MPYSTIMYYVYLIDTEQEIHLIRTKSKDM